MASEWYYESMGLILGPISAEELLRKVRRGEVGEATRVRKDDSQWVDAIEVGGLFEAAHRAAIQYTCPYCGGVIEKPPTLCLQCDREISAAYLKRDKTATPPVEPSRRSHAPEGRSGDKNATAPSPARRDSDDLSPDDDPASPSVIRWLRSWVQ